MSFSSAFGQRHPLSADEATTLNARAARALGHARKLKLAVDKWRTGTTFVTRTVIVEPDRTEYEIHVDMSRSYPHDQWALIAGDLAHSARAALDNLNDRLFQKYATAPYEAKRIQFPITRTGKEWRSWRQSHGAAPGWLVERYKQLQPVYGNYQGLAGLAAINNEDKHIWLRRASLALTESLGRGTVQVEGPPPSKFEVVPHDNFLERGQRSVLVATVKTGARILDLPTPAGNSLAPVLHFHIQTNDDTEFYYSLEELAEIPARVLAAIEYVNGDPGALRQYQSMPESLIPHALEDLKGMLTRALSEQGLQRGNR